MLLTVYRNETLKSLEVVESAHNGGYGNDAALEFDADAGRTYYFAVDADRNDAGTFILKYGPSPLPR